MTQHACGLDVTYCDGCGDELEEGQTGKCVGCREYSFDELSEEAKTKARENFTSRDYLDYEWWDSVYENAVQVAAILGIYVANYRRDVRTGKQTRETRIFFSGFSSQGDGACFEGHYTFNEDAVKKINNHCKDAKLIRIATALTSMQITQRLNGCEPFMANIRQSGNYSHSYTMSADIDDWGIDEVGEPDEGQFIQLMRDFADWIYAQLEAEYDDLHSDECVDQYLADEKFDVDGTVI